MGQLDEWFPLRRPVARPRARLLCLPCAGAGASMFRTWSDALGDVDVLAAQLPGREHRVRQRPLTALPDLLDALEAALRERAGTEDVPLHVFGHSLGAMVGFALCRRLAHDPLLRPRSLIAAGARAPHLPPSRILHDLPLATLLDELVRLGGTSPRVLAEPDLVALIEPPLRADLRLAETNVLAASPPLALPILALGGTDDPHIPAAAIEAWREVAGAGCEVAFVRGGHFFVRDQQDEVVRCVAARLGG